MSTEVKEVQTEIFMARGTALKQHPFGDIMFFNSDLVTPNTLDILMASLDDAEFNVEGHGILSVVFRLDGYPMAQENLLNSWAFSADAYSAMCNIQHCIELAFEDGLDSGNEHAEKVSVYAGVWRNMIKGFFHESWHSRSGIIEPYGIRFDKEFRKDEEEMAPVFAKEQLIALAKLRNIEIDFTPEIKALIDERLLGEIQRIEDDKKATKRDKAWVFHQKFLLEKGGVFYAPPEKKDEEGLHLMTFKEFLHFFSDDAEDDPSWDANTIGVEAVVTTVPLNENADGGVPGAAQTQLFHVDPDADPFDADDPLEVGGSVSYEDDDYQTPAPGFQGVAAVAPATVVAPITAPAAPLAPVVVAPVVGAATTAIVLSAGANPQTVINGLYMKMFTHIFQACQYSPTQAIPFPGGANITQWLELTEDESKLVVSMDMYSTDPAQRGVVCPNTPVDKHLSGILVDKAGTLPGYKLTLTTPDGVQIKRNFFPQNPNKVGENNYVSEPAQMAKGGAQIMWIVDADTKEYKLRVVNGVFQSNLGNRQWG